MSGEEMIFQFHDSEQYAFLFENVHLLMVAWNRDEAKFLFRIHSHQSSQAKLQLAYPGETFTNRVLDTIENIFFIQVQEEGKDSVPCVLGSYYEANGQVFGAYYEKDNPQNPKVVLFRVQGEPPNQTLEVPSEEEYRRAAEAFTEQHGDFVDIERTNEL